MRLINGSVIALLSILAVSCAGSTSAEDIRRNVSKAQESLVASLGPNTRFEMTQEIVEYSSSVDPGVPFALPEVREVRLAAEFGDNGELVAISS